MESRPSSTGSMILHLHDLLERRAVLPADLVLRDAAERVLDDRVGAPLVAGRAVRVTGVDGVRGLAGGRGQRVDEPLAARGDVTVPE